MRVPPRLVQFPAVGYQTVAEFVGRVQKRILATFGPDVDGDISNKRIGVGVFRSQIVFPQYLICGQVEHVDGVRTYLFRRVTYILQRRTIIQ